MAPPPSPVRWGILSTGKVAQDFCVALKKIFKDDPSIGAIVAVGSRSLDTAQQFATRFNVSQAYGSYEELVNAPDVDIIYIASPHSHHYEHALLAMRANKNIICEKALTLSAAQAEILVQEARTRKLFFMEAVWTRYFPLIQNVFGAPEGGAKLLDKIGAVRYVNVNFAFVDPGVPRLTQPELGGGALLDIGVYTLNIADLAFQGQEVEEIQAIGDVNESHIDLQAAVNLRYKNGGFAQLFFSLKASAPSDALIVGEKGFIRIHGPFWCPVKVTVESTDSEGHKHTEELEFPLPDIYGEKINFTNSHGFVHEAQYAIQAIQEGRKESHVFDLEGSLRLMRLIEQIKQLLGVRYPNESV